MSADLPKCTNYLVRDRSAGHQVANVGIRWGLTRGVKGDTIPVYEMRDMEDTMIDWTKEDPLADLTVEELEAVVQEVIDNFHALLDDDLEVINAELVAAAEADRGQKVA